MESTGIYSNPVFHALAEFGDFEVIKVNPAHVKNPVPGRKTDAADCAWLAELLECGLLRGSCIPVQKIAELRDLTRYRARLAGSRTSADTTTLRHRRDSSRSADLTQLESPPPPDPAPDH